MGVSSIFCFNGLRLGIEARGILNHFKREISAKYEKSNETMTLMRENMGRYEENVFLKKRALQFVKG